jgi:3-oxoacyl-(acyl-carrier-protein) synthase
VELAICAEAARARALPPNPTLIEPDPDLGRLCLLTRPAVLRPGPILKTSLGFGGHVAALIVEPA